MSRHGRVLLLALTCGLLALAGLVNEPARAQSDAELETMPQRIEQLTRGGKHDEGVALAQRYVEAIKARRGTETAEYAAALNSLAVPYMYANRYSEAEALFRQALAICEKHLDPNRPELSQSLNNLGGLLFATNRSVEAEPLLRRALAIDEKARGSDHPDLAIRLALLAQLLMATNRVADAEPMMQRALAITEKRFGPDHPAVARQLDILAALLRTTNRRKEAETHLRRALNIDEKSLGGDHPIVAYDLRGLAMALQGSDHPEEAEPLLRRALAIHEKSLGTDHLLTGGTLEGLALALYGLNRLDEAKPYFRRALAILDKNLGPTHPYVAFTLNNLAVLSAEQGNWTEAAALGQRAKRVLISRRAEQGNDRSGHARALLASNSVALRAHARAVFRANASDTSAREEGFELAQWALQTGAADALAQVSVRFAKGNGPLADLVRKRQEFIVNRQGEMRRLDSATGLADKPKAEEARVAVAGLDKQLDAVDARLSIEFKDYAELANPKPLTIAAARALLRPNEALMLFLHVPQPEVPRLAEEVLAWVLTKEAVHWRSIPLGIRSLSDRVAALRCGLDRSSWDSASEWPEETALEKQRIAEQQARRDRCKKLLGLEVSSTDWPPFDLAGAHELYQALLAPFEDVTRSKHLIIVPSGPLTNLPFHVLVTQPPDPALVAMARYRRAAWLALRQSVTVLPSVGSLQALRKLAPSQAKKPYIAFGNPLLVGPSGNDKRAWDKQACRSDTALLATARGTVRGGVSLRAIDLAELRAQAPLPETADELCVVAKMLGSLRQERESVWLGERATEGNVKALSREGTLARYKVIHFATHGLLSGESEAILSARAEPALVLTPPKDDTPAAELAEDDGLLTASEVAQLRLDADWVVLSACNTAAGEKGDAEALSGLARAFFYAKARALLVSHWYVSSVAAVKLTTKAFAELEARPNIGRAEALRRSMVDLIQRGSAQDAHPAMWAPFVLVGEGGR